MNWAAAPVARAKFDRNAVEIPRYADIERAFERDIHTLVEDHGEGKLSSQQVYRRFEDRLRRAQLEAFIAGRRAKGITGGDITEHEAAMLDTRARHQMTFFRRFLGDMEEGKGRMGYLQRGSLYAKSLWSLFTRAESVNWNDPKANVRYFWIMDVDAEHCKDCLRKAGESRRNGGFTYDELVAIGFPGDGLDQCRTNCRCHVRPVGKRTVTIERIPDHAATTPDAGLKQLAELFGGEHFPLRAPASGLPSVKLPPSTIEQAMASTPNPTRLGKLLPLLPAMLLEPLRVIEPYADQRLYIGYGLAATTKRDEAGTWWLTSLVLAQDQT